MYSKQDNIVKRNVIFIILSAMIFMAIFFIGIYKSFMPKNITCDGVKGADSSIKYSIEAQKYDESNNCITINGWAFIEGNTIKNYECEVVLKNNETNEYIKMPTQLVIRKDVTEFFEDSQKQLNYDKSGFKGKVQLSKLKENLKKYEICLYYNSNNANELITTGIRLTKVGNN